MDGLITVTIADSGEGMSPEFIHERLFRPFDSTRGSESVGVGAYQARDYLRCEVTHWPRRQSAAKSCAAQSFDCSCRWPKASEIDYRSGR